MFQILLVIIYLSFISLGLPDSILGAAWPSMYPVLQVPVSYAGILSMIIAAGTIVSSLQSDRLTRWLGTGKVTAISVAMTAAAFAGMFFIGITVGRALSGFVTMKFNDTQMIRLGQGIVGAGILLMLLPFSNACALVGLIVIGLGCAPIYPCVIHSTPAHFGADKSQAIIGIQMASAYVGTCLMPPVFGLIASHISVALLPGYLLIFLVLMVVMHEALNRKVK